MSHLRLEQLLAQYRELGTFQDVTFHILTKNRFKAAMRQLDIFGAIGANVLVLDGSDDLNHDLRHRCAQMNRVEYFHSVKYERRLQLVSETKVTPYSMLLTDDDVFILSAIRFSLDKLRSDTSLGSIVGAGAALMLGSQGNYGCMMQLGSYVDQRREYNLMDSDSQRRLMREKINRMAQTWYVPQRTEVLTNSLFITQRAMTRFRYEFGEQAIFIYPFDKLYCSLVALFGKVLYIPAIMWLRWGPDRSEFTPTWWNYRNTTSSAKAQTLFENLRRKGPSIVTDLLKESGISQPAAEIICQTELDFGETNLPTFIDFWRIFKRKLRNHELLDSASFRYLTSSRRFYRACRRLSLDLTDYQEIEIMLNFLDEKSHVRW